MQSHLDIWASNFGIQEFVGIGIEKSNEVFSYELKVTDGMSHVGDNPVLGVDSNEEAAAKYPYNRTYLPVSRLEDRTLWRW